MTVRSVEQGADPEVLNIGLEDGSLFFIRVSYLDPPYAASGIAKTGKELSEDEAAALSLAAERLNAERAALRLIALREHSRAELSLKLRKRGFEDRSAAVVLDRLEREGLVDDDRFAVLWTEARIARRDEGKRVLIAKLRSRGVSREASSRAVERVLGEEGEADLAERFIRDAGERTSRDDRELRERLRKAGFASGAIREALERFDR